MKSIVYDLILSAMLAPVVGLFFIALGIFIESL